MHKAHSSLNVSWATRTKDVLSLLVPPPPMQASKSVISVAETQTPLAGGDQKSPRWRLPSRGPADDGCWRAGPDLLQ